MSKSQRLRVLVTERLTAAAEEIFSLFERTMAEYEEELRRSQNENQRKQRFLDEVLNPRVLLPRAGAGVQGPSSPGPGLSQDIPETAEVKEEPEEQEQEQLSEFFPDFSTVSVKTEESSLLHGQTEHREETQENILELQFHSETEGDAKHLFDTNNNDKCKRPLSSSGAETKTEAGDHYNQVQFRDSTAAQNTGLSTELNSVPETSAAVNKGNRSRTDEGDERKKFQCSLCKKRLLSYMSLQLHIRLHTGERPYSCPVCKKAFNQKCHLERHKRLHTGEKPYSCLSCNKRFSDKSNFDRHRRSHTGDSPYVCSICNKVFSMRYCLKNHMSTHREGEKWYSCSLCTKTFCDKNSFYTHRCASFKP